MNEESGEVFGTAQSCRAPIGYRLRAWIGGVRHRLRDRLFRAAMVLTEDGGLISHAKRELAAVGYDPNQKAEDPDKWIQQNLLDLLRVMSMQGHSGFSASYLVTTFAELARYQPLGPLTGADSEWVEVGNGVWQNNRCSHVFKQADRFNGQAYDIDGRIFREPNGCTYTSAESRVPITFPYKPTRVYVDVPAQAD
jgi:hypothetical protein